MEGEVERNLKSIHERSKAKRQETQDNLTALWLDWSFLCTFIFLKANIFRVSLSFLNTWGKRLK